MSAIPSPDFACQVQALRPQLLRFARTQLRNEAWAEDAVSDTLLAALGRPQAFAGRSQLKTWLVGILKHKVVDQLRRHTRATGISSSRCCSCAWSTCRRRRAACS
jgi:RNA polymerase sigma-70 factor (ECF subfamily)